MTKEGSTILFVQKVLFKLSKLEIFNNLEQMSYYQNTERNLRHIIWCKVLFLTKQLAFYLVKEAGKIHQFLEFIKIH